MNIKICKACRGMFQHVGGVELCEPCKEIAEDETIDTEKKQNILKVISAYDKEQSSFLQVRDYLDRNPSANMLQICSETGVNSSLIFKWMKEGKLRV